MDSSYGEFKVKIYYIVCWICLCLFTVQTVDRYNRNPRIMFPPDKLCNHWTAGLVWNIWRKHLLCNHRFNNRAIQIIIINKTNILAAKLPGHFFSPQMSLRHSMELQLLLLLKSHYNLKVRRSNNKLPALAISIDSPIQS